MRNPTAATVVAEIVQGILGHPEFTAAICEELTVHVPPRKFADERDREAHRHSEFQALTRRVAVEIDAHPRKASLIALLRDDDAVHDSEAVELFNFIYFSMVNRFKGELAELLARPLLRDFSALLKERYEWPGGLAVIPGHEILERRKRGGVMQQGWFKGADAFVTAPSETVAAW